MESENHSDTTKQSGLLEKFMNAAKQADEAEAKQTGDYAEDIRQELLRVDAFIRQNAVNVYVAGPVILPDHTEGTASWYLSSRPAQAAEVALRAEVYTGSGTRMTVQSCSAPDDQGRQVKLARSGESDAERRRFAALLASCLHAKDDKDKLRSLQENLIKLANDADA